MSVGFIGLWMQWQLEAGVQHPLDVHGQDVAAAVEASMLHRAAELQSPVGVECWLHECILLSNTYALPVFCINTLLCYSTHQQCGIEECTPSAL